MRNAMRLSALIGFEVAAVVVLHGLAELPWLQLPRGDLSSWAQWASVTPPEDVIAAVVRLTALAAAYWLLASTVCYTAATAARLPRAIRVAGWATLPSVRRVADRAVAVVLVTSTVVGVSSTAGASPTSGASPVAGALAAGASPVAGVSPVAGASRPAPPVPPLPPRPPASDEPAPSVPPPGADPTSPTAAPPPALPDVPPPLPDVPLPPPDVPPPDRGATSERPRPAPATYVVEPGDSLWTITATHLEASGADHDTAAIHAVWVEVVAANRERLRSGDPDLIHPGETISLSPLPEHGSSTSA